MSPRKLRGHLSEWSASCPPISTYRFVVHQSTSIPTGLTDLAAKHEADLVVVGSSSSGLLGRVGLGSVTDRLVHTAAVPVAIAPRGYPMTTDPDQPANRGIRRRTPMWSASSRPVPSWPSDGRCDCGSSRSRCGRCRCSPARSSRPLRTLSFEQWSRRTSRRYRQAAQRCSRSHSDSGRRRGRSEPGYEWREAVEECLLGNRRHAGAGVRGGRSGGSGFPRLGCLENPASRPGSRDDRAQTPSAGLAGTPSPPSTMQRGP